MPDVHSLIEKLPHPKKGWTVPSISGKYCGPLNPLETQLDENDKPIPSEQPVHELDQICLWHDLKYRDFPEEKHRWDKEMLKKIDNLGPSSGWKESIARKLVKGIIWGKVKLGLGAGTGRSLATDVSRAIDRLGLGAGTRAGGCLDESDDEDASVIILHAPNLEMGKLLKDHLGLISTNKR